MLQTRTRLSLHLPQIPRILSHLAHRPPQNSECERGWGTRRQETLPYVSFSMAPMLHGLQISSFSTQVLFFFRSMTVFVRGSNEKQPPPTCSCVNPKVNKFCFENSLFYWMNQSDSLSSCAFTAVQHRGEKERTFLKRKIFKNWYWSGLSICNLKHTTYRCVCVCVVFFTDKRRGQSHVQCARERKKGEKNFLNRIVAPFTPCFSENRKFYTTLNKWALLWKVNI